MDNDALEYAAAKGMASKDKPLWNYIATLGALASCLLLTRWIAAHVLEWYPLLPGGVVMWLLFLYQTAFPYGYVHGSGPCALFIRSIAGTLSAIQWIAVSAGLLWLTQRIRLRYVLVIVPIVIIAVAYAVPMLLDIFGLRLELDGP